MQVSEGLRRVRGPPFPRVPPLWGRTRKAPAAPAPAGPLPRGRADTATANYLRATPKQRARAGEAMRGTAPCRARAAGTRTAGAEPGGAASARHGPAQGRGGGGSSSPVPARRRHRFLSPSCLPGAQRERDARAAPAPPRAANRGREGREPLPALLPDPLPSGPGSSCWRSGHPGTARAPHRSSRGGGRTLPPAILVQSAARGGHGAWEGERLLPPPTQGTERLQKQ